jgi:uncharacterized protein (TIGR00369 family)
MNDDDPSQRIRESFGRQEFMRTLGAELASVTQGAVEIRLSIRKELQQQHGFAHAGVVASIADSACGYAALSLMEPGDDVVSVEFKLNLLSPAVGEQLLARARVVRSGRRLSVTACDVFALARGEEKCVATFLGTMMRQ